MSKFAGLKLMFENGAKKGVRFTFRELEIQSASWVLTGPKEN